MSQIAWHNLTIKEALSKLKTTSLGLKDKEVEKRRRKLGPNKLLEDKKLGKLTILLSQFKNPLIYILLIAAAISFLLREFIDMVVILLAVAVNTVIGFLQENKANQALVKLKKLVEYRARVIRAGTEREVKVEELVPGDIVLLRAGDRVPADARIIESRNLQVNEASLTGESSPVDKITDVVDRGAVLADRKNMVYMGTMVIKGRARVVVANIGTNTYLGETAALIKETKEDKTPLQIRLRRLSEFIGLAVAVIVIFLLLLGFLQGRGFFEMFIMAVAIAVSAVPEGLTIAVTVILAIGMQRILKKGSLVRTLVAAETLGSVTIICTDKTGTLTEGKMSVARILTGNDLKQEKFTPAKVIDFKRLSKMDGHLLVLTIGLLCNNAVIENPQTNLEDWVILGDSTERALLLAGYQAGLDKSRLEDGQKRIDEIPFSSESKYMATLHQGGKRNIIYLKGAPEKIIARVKYLEIGGKREILTAKTVKILQNHYLSLTKNGLRVLALAYKEVPLGVKNIQETDLEEMVFVGFVGIKDPLRKEVKYTIAATRKAGIRPVIITGDHLLTAKAIAAEAGLEVAAENIIEGKKLNSLSDEELRKRVGTIDLYARVTPKHKIRIVDALQARGEVVAMTGDGVNDAPAIKSADIGLALGSGADVTKETADIVLLDNNFRIIIEAIKQGRIIFENIKKVIVYLMSDSFTEVILIGGSLFFHFPLPLLAAQILWVNIISDSFPAFALSFEKEEREVMQDKPRPKNYPILDTEMKVLIFIIGVITDLILFIIFIYLWKTTGDLPHVRTFVFVALGIDSLFYIYACRSFRKTIIHFNPFSNKLLNWSVIFGVATMVLSVYWSPLQSLLSTVPLSLKDWTILVSLGIMEILLIEFTKWFFLYKETHKKILSMIKK